MKHIRNIFLLIILLLFSVITAHSQNEKLWEFDASPHGVYDVEHFGDDKFIYISHTQNTFYYITVRNLLDTTLVMQKEIDYKPWKIYISNDKDYFYISRFNGGFSKYDFQLNLLEIIPQIEFEFEGAIGETLKGWADINMQNEIASILQGRDNNLNKRIRRIIFQDLNSGEVLHVIPINTRLNDVQFSPDGRYFTYSEDQWPAKVRFFDAQTYEHEFDLESRNDDDKDNILSSYTFSPTGKYVLIHFRSNNDRYLNYNLELRNVDYILPKTVVPPFLQPVYYLTDDYYFTAPTFPPTDAATIIKKQGFDSTHYYPSEMGLFYLSYQNKLILSMNLPSFITLAQFDPELVSVEIIDDTVEVYPQPSSGIFNISLDESYLNKTYHLFDSQGIELKQGQINNIDNGFWQINLFDQPNGIYYLQIEELTFKLIKEV